MSVYKEMNVKSKVIAELERYDVIATIGDIVTIAGRSMIQLAKGGWTNVFWLKPYIGVRRLRCLEIFHILE